MPLIGGKILSAEKQPPSRADGIISRTLFSGLFSAAAVLFAAFAGALFPLGMGDLATEQERHHRLDRAEPPIRPLTTAAATLAFLTTGNMKLTTAHTSDLFSHDHLQRKMNSKKRNWFGRSKQRIHAEHDTEDDGQVQDELHRIRTVKGIFPEPNDRDATENETEHEKPPEGKIKMKQNRWGLIERI